ncbi:hypothetical protein RI054_18g83970 [Pseudoscourfieldia marina]
MAAPWRGIMVEGQRDWPDWVSTVAFHPKGLRIAASSSLSRAQQLALLDEVCDEVLAGRARRSLLERDDPTSAATGASVGAGASGVSATRTLTMTTFERSVFDEDVWDEEGSDDEDVWDEEGSTTTHVMEVMLTDGTKRPARSIFEWLQQFCIEQVTLRTALRKRGVAVPKDDDDDDCLEDMPCLLARADQYQVPQLCMGCGDWWTVWSLCKKEEKEVLEAHRSALMTACAAKIVIEKIDTTNTIWKLIEPLVTPTWKESLQSFPCKKDDVATFITHISLGECPKRYFQKEDDQNAEAFWECDYEDAEHGAYLLSTSPDLNARGVARCYSEHGFDRYGARFHFPRGWKQVKQKW